MMVGVNTGVSVAVGVAVRLGVGESVGIAVWVIVAVTVGVSVIVAVAVARGVGVMVGTGVACARLQPVSPTASRSKDQTCDAFTNHPYALVSAPRIIADAIRA